MNEQTDLSVWLRNAVSEWAWVSPVRWAAVVFAAAALVGSVCRKRKTLPEVFAGVAAAASWFASPLAAAAVVAVAVWSVKIGRRASNRSRTRRGIGSGAATLFGCWAVSLGVAGRHWFVPAVCAAGAVALALWPSKPAAVDEQRMFTPAQRAEVIARDGNRCSYCGVPGDSPGVQLAVDHVYPHSRGGRTEVSNAAMACTPCNASKGNKTVQEWAPSFRARHGFDPGEFDRPTVLRRIMSR